MNARCLRYAQASRGRRNTKVFKMHSGAQTVHDTNLSPNDMAMHCADQHTELSNQHIHRLRDKCKQTYDTKPYMMDAVSLLLPGCKCARLFSLQCDHHRSSEDSLRYVERLQLRRKTFWEGIFNIRFNPET